MRSAAKACPDFDIPACRLRRWPASAPLIEFALIFKASKSKPVLRWTGLLSVDD
jgi:hypothetical protein